MAARYESALEVEQEKKRGIDHESARASAASIKTIDGSAEHIESCPQDDRPNIKSQRLVSEAMDQWPAGGSKVIAPPSSPRPASAELSGLPATKNTTEDDELMPPLSRCPSSLFRSTPQKLPAQLDRGSTAVPDEWMSPLSRCPPSSSKPARLGWPTHRKNRRYSSGT